MAKILKYKFVCGQENVGTDEAPIFKDVISDVEMTWSEGNEETAKREAVNGEYEIVDDGTPEPPPTQIDRIEALEAAVTMLCMPDVSEV